VTTMLLQVRGVVPGLDEAGFVKLATEAEEKCPISNAIRGNVQIELNATLA